MTNQLAHLVTPVCLAFCLLLGAASAPAPAADLSKYRIFKFGATLASVAKDAATDPAQAKVIHSRPVLIQELSWRPQPLGSTAQVEPAKDVVFSFYNGELFQIAVNYDHYATEGMTDADLIDAISVSYGPASSPAAQLKSTPAPGRYGDPEEVLAQWEDPEYRFGLIRSTYGPSYRLVGVLKRLDLAAQASVTEALRLDEKEAPEKEAQRLAAENETARAKLEKARLLNKPKFRL